MRKTFILIGVALLGLLLFPATLHAAPSAFAASIVKLQTPTKDATPFCSGFVIDGTRGLVMTAEHCMGYPFPPVINGQFAMEIWHNIEKDIAVLSAPGTIGIHSLNPRADMTEWNEEVVAWGYPNKSKTLKSMTLRIIFPVMARDNESGLFWVAKPEVKAGMSGGPVLDANGNVIGIIQASMKNTYLSVGRATPTLYAISKEFWEFQHGAPAALEEP